MKIKYILCSVILLTGWTSAQEIPLTVNYKGDSQIEVGGPYVGVEMHHSAPSPERISFYYPVANSIDLSTDYWRRDTTFVSSVAVKAGNGKREIVGFDPAEYNITPYSVSFMKNDKDKSLAISYHFSRTRPAMFIIYELANKTGREETFQLDTRLETSVKTSHTFKLKDSARTAYDSEGITIYTNFDDPETQNVQIFAANAGLQPAAYEQISRGKLTDFLFDGKTGSAVPEGRRVKPCAAFLYKQTLKPGEKMTVVQVIGSCRQNEGRANVSYLIKNYRQEIDDFENSVKEYAYRNGKFITGDRVFDRTYYYAKAILDVNRHYIDSVIRPMPCPAEYNFYFSHDVFLTDLSAVNFDLPRVKLDLEYTMKHSDKDNIIPHAYYWKDSTYKTEYATPDNWNYWWFIIASASYLRHSGDTALALRLYPYLQKSADEALKNNKDGLLYAYRPDWWDIGHNYGPRAFMTILASKALKDYVYILNTIKRTEKLQEYESLSLRLQAKLNERLWDDSLKYLVNYFEDGSEDRHYYIGSLPAAPFELISKERIKDLTETAEKKLLDNRIGIYTVYPMDFHKLISYLKFAGNEAGDPYMYINGGVWSHGNTFYALALKEAGRTSEAVDFVKRIMTLDGILKSPNGQPAMYEYRIAKKDSPAVYGKVDKPQFMWAAGFYIYSLYHLFGIDEGTYNIRFTPYLMKNQNKCTFMLSLPGGSPEVSITGKGEYIKKIKYDGISYPSAVIPEITAAKKIEIEMGRPETPYVNRAESVLKEAGYNKDLRELSITLSAFSGHRDPLEVISPLKPKEFIVNGKDLIKRIITEKKGEAHITHFNFEHDTDITHIQIKY